MRENVILAVDLDNTLIKADILYEAFWRCAASDASQLVASVPDIFSGWAKFKRHISESAHIDPSNLAYNERVLDYIRAWREQGGKAVLITATDHEVARAIAEHVGLFDEVFGSDGVCNLKGDAKVALLTERYGAGNYDYIGDAKSDLPVWRSARQAITVGASEGLRRRVRSEGGILHLTSSTSSMRSYIKALRPHQWCKNLLVFLPLIAAHEASMSSWATACLAFLCFCLVASSVYVLNDLLDLEADRRHPRKRLRPFASGAVPLEHGTVMVPALLFVGLFLGLFVGELAFLGVLLLYYVVTTAYSLLLKRKMIIDICTLAGLYTLRIFAGGVATGLPISEWLFAFSIFFFFSLAAVKRQAELVDATNSSCPKVAGRSYLPDDRFIISMMATSSGYIAVLVMALYLDSPAVRQLYHQPLYLWVVCPILLYWVSRMVVMASRGMMDDDPIVYAARDRISRYCGILAVLVVLAAMI